MNRIEQLLGRMSLAEKLGQLTMSAADAALTGPMLASDLIRSVGEGTTGNVLNLTGAEAIGKMQRIAVEQSRLGIPLLFALDVLHGYRTLFPTPLSEAAALDAELWTLTAREAAREAAADGLAMTFAPMLDVSRDPRWGRVAEGPGEDPWLAARIAEAKVRGFQGADLAAADSIAACAKHYLGYGAVTAGRDYAPVDISERTLHEVYLPPFAAAVAAGVAAIMPAFTDLAGIPMSAHRALLKGWLRERLKFDGLIVSDYNAIGELARHGIAADLAEAASLALSAGVDVDMMSGAYLHGLPLALERGWVALADVDESVRRVLRLKLRLGLFDDPYRRGAAAPAAEATAERRLLARTVGARALILLKNEPRVLPWDARTRRIALIGPLADAAAEMRGPWRAVAKGEEQVSVAAGLRAVLGEANVLYAEGTAIEGEDESAIPAALALCEHADAILLCLGEAARMSGEAASRTVLDLPGAQRPLALAVLERARSLGKPVVATLFSGRPLIVPWLLERADAVLAAGFLGSEAGHALADVLFGRVSPGGRTPMTWPRALGQVPLFFGQRPSGRPHEPGNAFCSKYLDESNQPQACFGFGLTYGCFALSNLRVPARPVAEHDVVTVAVDVRNEGARAAEETVFLFVRDKLASVARPLLELRGFGKISLNPGESGTVTLHLSARELRFLGVDLRPVFEPGEVEILVGPCADRSRLLAASIHLEAASM